MNDFNLNNLRHSCSHLLAAAVLDLYPDALPTIGPAIDDGFYYDFANLTISDSDLLTIEERMHKLSSEWKSFEKIETSISEIKKLYKNNKFKIELANEFFTENKPLTLYKSGNFTDLCGGGHVENPKDNLNHFKLLSVAGAYWRGSEKNEMLTRIYGTCFFTSKELENQLQKLEESKKRDHRKIGKDMGLFTFSDLVGKGLPLFTDKGQTVIRELEKFVIDEEIKRGYKHVRTPNLTKTALYKKSGHYPYYKDSMYPVMTIDNEELILRPMTCPHHFALFLDRPRSYRELPLRFAEMASLYRYEKSGELSGLIRVREFTLADSHNFVAKSQAKSEINSVLDLIDYISKTLGIEKDIDYTYRLSLGDLNNKDKFFDDPENWKYGEEMLRSVLTERKEKFYEAAGEAAFYGPKIDIQMKNALGKEDTAFTVQYDFCLPKRFDLTFINEKGENEQPIVIHRSSIGCLERSLAFLIEHYSGAFPVWIHPVQVIILPINDRNIEYSQSVLEKLKNILVRVELDDRNDTLNSKIRDAQLNKIPYIIVIGDKEESEKTISVRLRSGKVMSNINLEDFLTKVQKTIKEKSINLEI